MSCEFRIHSDSESLGRAAALALVDVVRQTLETNDHFSIALSGGATPLVLYGLLAGEFASRFPWDRVHFYWGDERYVSHDDPQSNFRVFRESVMSTVRIPLENIHPMSTSRSDPDDGARDYEALLRNKFGGDWPRFNVILLGMGKDGHIASLFPGSAALDEKTRWVVSVRADAEPPVRLTLTPPVMNAASNVWFIVSGSEKAGILKRVMTGPPDPRRFPASAVRLAKGGIVWWVDEDAAASSGLENSRESR